MHATKYHNRLMWVAGGEGKQTVVVFTNCNVEWYSYKLISINFANSFMKSTPLFHFHNKN